MSVYMYNVLFDFNRAEGLFEDPQKGTMPPLEISKHWLMEVPSPSKWEDLGVASSLLVRDQGQPDEIRIRVAPKPGQKLSPGATLQIAVSFGRPAKFEHKRGSPFNRPGAGGGVLTTFIETPPRGPDGGWTLSLGTISARPGNPRKTLVHRYEFSLGVIVNDPAPPDDPATPRVRHYSEDPEMDVGD